MESSWHPYELLLFLFQNINSWLCGWMLWSTDMSKSREILLLFVWAKEERTKLRRHWYVYCHINHESIIIITWLPIVRLPTDRSLFLLVISMLLRQEVSIQLFYYCIHFLNCGFAYFFSPMWFNFILSLNFIFSLFVGMVLYDNEFQQRKWNLNQG